MPETTVNENDLPSSRENDVWLSGKVGNVEPESVSAGAGDFSHQEFRFCVLAADERHSFTALKPRQRVHNPCESYPMALSRTTDERLTCGKGIPREAVEQEKSFAFSSPRLGLPSDTPVYVAPLCWLALLLAIF